MPLGSGNPLDSVSRETFADLEKYADLLKDWTARINLVAPSTVPDLWARHIKDSAQLAGLIGCSAQKVVDFGSGGGLPGVVLALIARDTMPDQRFQFVESDKRKSVFLRLCVQQFELNASVITRRAERLDPLQADVMTARAFTNLNTLTGLAHIHLAPSGIAIFPKGRSHEQELHEARRNWVFDLETHPSISSPEAKILVVRNIKRA